MKTKKPLVAQVNYPEHKKLNAVVKESQECGAFLEWLLERYYLAQYANKRSETLVPVHVRIADVLAEYFGINQDKLEAEKQHMLEALRQEQPKEAPHAP